MPMSGCTARTTITCTEGRTATPTWGGGRIAYENGNRWASIYSCTSTTTATPMPCVTRGRYAAYSASNARSLGAWMLAFLAAGRGAAAMTRSDDEMIPPPGQTIPAPDEVRGGPGTPLEIGPSGRRPPPPSGGPEIILHRP